MSEHSAKQHYEKLLARHYSWMFGDFEKQVEKNLNWFEERGVYPKSNQAAIDFGCGPGFQSIALSSLGFNVTAVDFNQHLLDELRSLDQSTVITVIHSDMLKPENYAYHAPFELAVCMGDTLPHLPTKESVSDFFHIVSGLLEPDGTLILSFRDYTTELIGIDRFIPVQSDQDKIMTVFLEYESDFVFVHDLVYKRNKDSWEFDKSVYKKVRLSVDQVGNLLDKTGFSIIDLQSEKGMIYVTAKK